MSNTTLAFLWHMHQPYYRDIVTGESTMPWVRLHGIHSYYDMIKLYERYPNVKGTMNFVPSLVEQLLAYTEEGRRDAFMDHTLVPAEDLTPPQKSFILRYFFMANPEQKIAPHRVYSKLLERRGLDQSKIDFQQAIRFFSAQDYLDIQVYYNLVWFGFTANDEIPELGQMLSRGGHFTEADKEFVLESQIKILKNLIEAMRRSASSTNLEISTTPYYHPIFPLLLDTDFALRANPKAELPPQIKLPQVAKEQIDSALEKMERWTGRRPRGVWPAEGSVCPEMVSYMADAGVLWMATDDRILERSLPKSGKGVSLHQPFEVLFEGKKINMVFRDHGLSDLIGFTYSKMPADKAVADFIGHVKKIGQASGGEKRLITVILDGENPWEFYSGSGKYFLRGLFESLEKEGIATASIGDYVRDNPPKMTLNELRTGSWIDANFNIWIGKPQKNTAWTYIKRTVDELGEALICAKDGRPDNVCRAFESFCAACGSDWFWWYDDDFDSAFKPDFDRLFRLHLKNAFTLLDHDIPLFLFEPIYRFADSPQEFAEPMGFIDPSIDGRRTSFFEWTNAIRYNVRGRGSTMAVSAEPFESITFGFNPTEFYLRIEPADGEAGFSIADGDELLFYINDGDKHYKLRLAKEQNKYVLGFIMANGAPPPSDSLVRWALNGLLEMALPFEGLKFGIGEKITIALVLYRQGVEIRRYSHIRFVVPDEAYEQKMWSV